MESKGLKIYEGLPNWAKGVVVVGGLGVTYIFVSQIIKKLRLDAERKRAEEGLRNVRDELQNQQNSGVPASYQKSVYDAFAQSLVDQFQGCDVSIGMPFNTGDYRDLSTSGKKVYDIIHQLNNNRDWLELVDSFGLKTYDACGYFTGNEENKTLYSAISSELNNSEVEFLNGELRNRGITYKIA